MKTVKRLCLLIMAAAAAALMMGCGKRGDVNDSYDVYETTAEHTTLKGSSSVSKLPFFASNLCVGGLENTESADGTAQSAESAAVFLLQDGDVSFAKNIYEKRYPASTTKILTAYVALKYGDPNQVVTVSETALSSLDAASSVCNLHAGDQITLRDVLYGLLLCSGNDAANVVAECICGSQDEFAGLMNEEARSLGATQSHFVNAHGLPDNQHYTTAYDLYLIFNAAIQNEDFVTIISSDSYNASYRDATGNEVTQNWENSNGYLSGEYEKPEGVTVVGGKTGTTVEAGYCLVLYSENGASEPVISIVMKDDSKSDLYGTMSDLLVNFSN